MNKRFPIYLILSALLSVFAVSCNSDDQEEFVFDDVTQNSVMISSFNIKSNDSVLVNLDSVFFSIDLDRAVIFNADSLPVGTEVDKLVLNISMAAVSEAELTMPTAAGADTTINFLTNPSDSINFTKGSVKLRLLSLNKKVERTYSIFVNVHKMQPDSLAWGNVAYSVLPTSLTGVEAQKTVEYKGKALCFTFNGTSYCRAENTDEYLGAWSKQTVSLPEGAKLETLTAAGDALFVTDEANMLHTSADKGSTWTSTGTQMWYIYGAYGNSVAGVRKNVDGTCTHVTYPASAESAVSAGCPVEATSTSLTYTTQWSDSPMLIVSGGVTASGETVGSTWAFDGKQWAKISIDPIPDLKSPVVVPYFSFKTSTDWVVSERTILLAFGGLDKENKFNTEVYLSYDQGVHWAKAPQYMQLPEGVRIGAYSQGLVLPAKMSDAAPAKGWTDVATAKLPAWYSIASPAASRATTPITSWDCPYIYVFGGVDPQGDLMDNVWRGVLNRLLFKPLQ